MTDPLSRARELAAQARDLQSEIADLEGLLSEKKSALQKILTTTLPDLCQENGLSALHLDPQGNQPGVEVTIRPYYRASIPVSWTEVQKAKAYDALEKFGAGSLIKTEVTLTFGKGKRQEAIAFAKNHPDLSPSIKESVHHSSLSAWLREQVEGGHATPDLETIGASVGSVAKLEARKS